jgi:hypothetical protein
LAGWSWWASRNRWSSSRRVQHQRALVDLATPAKLPGECTLLEAQLLIVGFHPTQVPLLCAPQQPQPLGGLVGLPGRGLERVLGQRQPVPGGVEVPPP